jgi:membrane protease YdiL (CAAX protease family)
LTKNLLPDSFQFMNCPDSIFLPPPSRIQAVFEIIMVSGIVSSFVVSMVFAAIFGRNRLRMIEMDVGSFVTYQVFEAAVTFLILLIIMKARRETLSGLGLRLQRWKTNVLLGVLAAPCLVVVSSAAGMIFQLFLPRYALDKNPLMEMIHSPRQLALFIVAAILCGGVKEELQRAFILRRFQDRLGGAKAGLIIWSLVFGAGHYVQGVQGVFAATILGLVFGALYLMRGNLILPVTAHAVYNTLALLIYWFVVGSNR